MRIDPPDDGLGTGSDYPPETEAMALLAQTVRMVAVADALVKSHRLVDVEGLQDQVGLLCAKALDLPPSRTGFLKVELARLAAALGTLSTSLQENAA